MIRKINNSLRNLIKIMHYNSYLSTSMSICSFSSYNIKISINVSNYFV